MRPITGSSHGLSTSLTDEELQYTARVVVVICDPRVLVDRCSLPWTCQCHIIVFTPSHSLYALIIMPTEYIAMDFVNIITVGILTRLVVNGNHCVHT
jgi:hypothetical protein